MSEEPKKTVSFQVDADAERIIENVARIVMDLRKMDRDEAMAYAFLVGVLTVQNEAKKAEAREPIVRAAIQKLKDETPVTDEELDAIFYAAKAGDVEAAIIMSDFKRFGRSVDKA